MSPVAALNGHDAPLVAALLQDGFAVKTNADGHFLEKHGVVAAVETHAGCLTIYEFSSTVSGQGNGRRFLADLKKWVKIDVMDAGYALEEDDDDTPGHHVFWAKMALEGLVDSLLNDSGHQVSPHQIVRPADLA